MINIPESANKGLENTVVCTTQVSTISGADLLYRGYKIEDLVERCTFEEVVFLLWNERLPKQDELKAFREDLYKNTNLSVEFLLILKKIAKLQAHPMAKLRTALSYLSLFDVQAEDLTIAKIREKALHLTAIIGPVVSALSCFQDDREYSGMQPGRSIAWNFLASIRGKQPTEEEEDLFDIALILHADHELNASTFAARVVVSTGSDYYSGIIAALGALKGVLHGGANEQVMLMLAQIGSYENVHAFIEDALLLKKKVMGVGHRVYKNGDPRAKILKNLSLAICKNAGLEHYHQILVRIAEEMESKKGLMPNVDFYSGLVYTALGLQSRDFTPIFAVSRIAGWSAQLLEQYASNRIYRPRAFYVGPLGLKV